MASSKPKPERSYIETGMEPEFYITETRYEAVGNGNIRRYAYVLRGNEFHLVHTEIIPIVALALMAQKTRQITADAHNLSMWESDSEAN